MVTIQSYQVKRVLIMKEAISHKGYALVDILRNFIPRRKTGFP